jgi:regulator of sigma D
MLDNCKNNQERWQAVDGLLQSWLKERRDVLIKYTAIATILDSRADRPPLELGLQGLCQILVDYVSAGHFEIYHELIREAEAFADGSDKLANELIPSIGDTTEVILGFDEKYIAAAGHPDSLGADLSLLGEVLESRFELEDRLIAVLHRSHAS